MLGEGTFVILDDDGVVPEPWVVEIAETELGRKRRVGKPLCQSKEGGGREIVE